MNTRHKNGFTLVEVMVTMLLASMVTSGIFYMMEGQTKTYRNQINRLTMQQNLWGASEYMQRQVQLAGYGVAGACPDYVARVGTSTGEPIFRSLTVYNACNILTDNPEAGAGCCAIGNTGPCIGQTQTNKSDSLSITVHPMVAQGEPTVLRSTQRMTVGTNVTRVNAPADFAANQLIMLREPGTTKQCIVRKLTQAPAFSGGDYQLTHSDAVISGGSGQGLNIEYEATSMVINLRNDTKTRHFAIDKNAKLPRLVTWLSNNPNPSQDRTDFEVIAEGVEDMQIAYACDDNQDGIFEEGADAAGRRSDEWVGNEPAEQILPDCTDNRIGVVRLSLIGRTPAREIGNKLGFRPAAEDRPAGNPDNDSPDPGIGGGTYPRSMITVRILPRNIR